MSTLFLEAVHEVQNKRALQVFNRVQSKLAGTSPLSIYFKSLENILTSLF